MRRAWWWALLVLGIAGAIVFYLLTMPRTVPASALPAHTPDLANGEYMFTAGGCAECHAEPLTKCKDTKIKDKQRSAGGRCLKTRVRRLQRAEHLSRQGDRHRRLGARSISSTR